MLHAIGDLWGRLSQGSGIVPYLLFLAGLLMIIRGTDWFVDSSVWIARVLDVPELIIGATLVSLCTTLPEATVSVSSALYGHAQMAIGNALGSIVCNTAFILGVTILFAQPPLSERKRLLKNGAFLLFLILLVFFIGTQFGAIGRIAGIVLLMLLALYLAGNIRDAKHYADIHPDAPVDKRRRTVVRNISLFILGALFTVGGSSLLVQNGVKIAQMIGVPDIVIGVTMTALGTSLPELVTAITAIRKKVYNLSVGNIIGADILNIVLVTGTSAAILPIPMDRLLLGFHVPAVFLIVSLVLLFVLQRGRFRRWNGAVLLALYAAYITLSFIPGIF
jgi:cation:H+ antiporter